MTETIGNPLSWSVDHARAAGKHLGAAATHIGHGDAGEVEMPRIRHLAVRDLKEVLQKGVEDFAACRTDVIFVCLLYPIIGVLLAWVALHNNLGWTKHDRGDARAALYHFEKAVEAADLYGTSGQQHVARWSVGRALRSLGRTDEALDLQRELARARPDDPYVQAEIEALTAAATGAEPTIEP